MISSKPSTILFSNLLLWFIIMSQNVVQKDWLAIFKVKVTARAHMIKIGQLLLYLLNGWSFCYQNWFVSTLSWARVFYGEFGLCSRSQKRFRIPVTVHLNDISSAAEPSVTKLGMVMQHHGPKYHARRFVSCLQVQGHSEGSFDQIWLFLPYLLNC